MRGGVAVALFFVTASAASGARAQTTADEPPPPPPRRHGVVVESSAGVLGFTGSFRNVAPPGPLFAVRAGYEVVRPVLVFAYGDLALTDTSVAAGPSRLRAFAIFGFGGGARAKVHASERVALLVEATVGWMRADVPQNALANVGYGDAEVLHLALAARAGVDWYQVDPHLALGVRLGARDATGFARSGRNETPLAYEGALSLRYAF